VRVQSITANTFIWRFIKLLLRPGFIRSIRALLASRPEDQRSMVDYLEDHAVRIPNHVALAYEDQRISWNALNERVNQLAHLFQQRGVRHGDRVAINMENRPEIVIGALACMKLGAIAGMVNTNQTHEGLDHSLTLIAPKLLYIGAECWANMETVGEQWAQFSAEQILFVADGDTRNVPAGVTDLATALAAVSTANVTPDQTLRLGDACYYIFTSGTTGLPKASITTHMKVYRGATQFGINVMTLTEDDVYYCPLPFYHSNALVVALGSCLLSGATLAMRRKFSASAFWDDCRAFGATAFIYIGELLRYLLVQPPRDDDQNHSVVKILGNGLRPDIWMDFKQRFGIDRIHEFYGASEANTGFVNILNFDKTCGWSPQYGTAWNVIAYDVDTDQVTRDASGDAQAVAKGEVGLLVMQITDQNPFDGYTDQQANEKKILRNLFAEGDAWFNSGDLVMLQPFGHIQFSDRIGDTFRWQGENVATTQVEGVVIQWPGIDEAAVYGVSVAGRDGQCGMLYFDAQSISEDDLDQLASFLVEKLPAYAVPRFLRLGETLSKTGTFKIQKSVLKSEGFSHDADPDPVFVLDRDAVRYLPLTAELRAAVEDGSFRL
jgi:acyl-CoA synthetase (AMP-forming)/AMP-acid ligase II